MKLENLFEGTSMRDAVKKVGEALGDRAYHDEMGGGRGGIDGIEDAAWTLSYVFDINAATIATKLRTVAEKEKKKAFEEKRGY